jgi:hypothetical protein
VQCPLPVWGPFAVKRRSAKLYKACLMVCPDTRTRMLIDIYVVNVADGNASAWFSRSRVGLNPHVAENESSCQHGACVGGHDQHLGPRCCCDHYQKAWRPSECRTRWLAYLAASHCFLSGCTEDTTQQLAYCTSLMGITRNSDCLELQRHCPRHVLWTTGTSQAT